MAFGVIKNHADTPSSTLGPKKKLISTSAEASMSFTSEQLLEFQADLEGNNSRAFLKEVDQIEGLCPTSNMLKNLQMLSKPRITLWQPVMVTNLLQIM